MNMAFKSLHSLTDQPMIMVKELTLDGDTISSGAFGGNVIEEVDDSEQATVDIKPFVVPQILSDVAPIKSQAHDRNLVSTTTVLIPSSIPGGEPQRLLIPTSTLLEIAGSSAPDIKASHVPTRIAPRSPVVGATPSLNQGVVPHSAVPSPNGSNFIIIQKQTPKLRDIPVVPKLKDVRFVPITAAPVTSSDTFHSHESIDLGIQESPNRDFPSHRLSSPTSVPTVSDAGVNRSRKPCNCTKSQCLKLYCDCFANGEFCFGCNCNNCFNNLEHEDFRQRAIKSCLDRNPYAFHPKIGKSKANGNETRRHAKGCNCRKSGCLKNYCECYEAKIPCTTHCKCVGCKNTDENDEDDDCGFGTSRAGIASRDSSSVGAIPASSFLRGVKHSEGPLSSVPQRPRPFTESGQRQPFSLLTQEVVDATTKCMLTSLERQERQHASRFSTTPTALEDAEAEAVVIEELGKCLRQIITAAKSTTSQS